MKCIVDLIFVSHAGVSNFCALAKGDFNIFHNATVEAIALLLSILSQTANVIYLLNFEKYYARLAFGLGAWSNFGLIRTHRLIQFLYQFRDLMAHLSNVVTVPFKVVFVHK